MGMVNHKDSDRLTHEAMLDPKPGDLYTEMFNNWTYVVKVTPKKVTYVMFIPPCKVNMQEAHKVKTKKKEKFREYFSYKSEALKDKYWVRLAERGADVSWYRE